MRLLIVVVVVVVVVVMSHHSEDGFTAGSDSFWEPGNYKRTTKRIEDGHNLCNELMNLVKDRAEIEKNYSKSLKAWAVKWNNIIEKGKDKKKKTKATSFMPIRSVE